MSLNLVIRHLLLITLICAATSWAADRPNVLFINDLTDPENLTNIATEKPEIVKSLGDAMDEWLKKTGEQLQAKTMWLDALSI
ncbi:MAG: hypothetical protein NTV80_21335 [Verrucomicrobia bacterium]|nr:hypothetical protein [Verrucomicrobiota bacterium]